MVIKSLSTSKVIGITLLLITCTWYVLEGRFWNELVTMPDAPALAEKLIKRGRPAEDCFRTFQIVGSYPPLSEAQFNCVKHYAIMKSDPAICEMAMPTNYGLDCLSKTTDHEPCGFFYEPNQEIRGQGKITTYDQCLSGPADIRNYSCCIMARISKDPDSKENCSSFQTDELKDQCHHEIARRDKNVAECAEMKNPTNRTGCEVGVRALLKQ